MAPPKTSAPGAPRKEAAKPISAALTELAPLRKHVKNGEGAAAQVVWGQKMKTGLAHDRLQRIGQTQQTEKNE